MHRRVVVPVIVGVVVVIAASGLGCTTTKIIVATPTPDVSPPSRAQPSRTAPDIVSAVQSLETNCDEKEGSSILVNPAWSAPEGVWYVECTTGHQPGSLITCYTVDDRSLETKVRLQKFIGVKDSRPDPCLQ